MISCGVDIVSIGRFCFLMGRYGERFLKRLFSRDEIDYCFEKKNQIQCFAGKFAAKEAAIKALGLKDVALRDIEVINIDGKPIIKVKGEVLMAVSLSISHDRDYAVAMCVREEEV